MRYLIPIAAALILPAAAHAQDAAAQRLEAQRQSFEAQQRLDRSQQRLQQYEQNQRVDQVQRQVEDLDLRLRTQQNLQTLQEQRAAIPRETAPLVMPAAPATPADLAEAERRRQASLEASEARLRALSAQQMR